ncbi:MAG: hypothetical protein ACOX5R_13230 [bacterium]|jgi:hypothetical protein
MKPESHKVQKDGGDTGGWAANIQPTLFFKAEPVPVHNTGTFLQLYLAEYLNPAVLNQVQAWT